MDCGTCRRSQRDGFINITCEGIDYVEKCKRPTDAIPKLSDRIRRSWAFAEKYLPGVVRPDGGFDFSGLMSAMDLAGVPKGQRPILYDRCLVVIEALREARRKYGKAET